MSDLQPHPWAEAPTVNELTGGLGNGLIVEIKQLPRDVRAPQFPAVPKTVLIICGTPDTGSSLRARSERYDSGPHSKIGAAAMIH